MIQKQIFQNIGNSKLLYHTLKGSLSDRKTIPGTSCSQNGKPLEWQI